MISSTGFMTPSALDTWMMETIFVFSLSICLNASRSITPSSSIGIIFKIAPLSSAIICQGTMLEWCSNVDIMISSPSFKFALPQDEATMLMPSVVPFVKMISWCQAAPMNSFTLTLLSSYFAVASSANVCKPLWILALQCV